MRVRGRIIIKRGHHAELVGQAIAGLRLRSSELDDEMPGRPHFVFPRRKAALFVCSCWVYGHGKEIRPTSLAPHAQWQSTADHERRKLDTILWVLRSRGWKASVVWGCDVATYGDRRWVTRDDLRDRVRSLVCSDEPATPQVIGPPA
jgi:G:T-mismatch repair DNA endonuclease (very short patch repair protein)